MGKIYTNHGYVLIYFSKIESGQRVQQIISTFFIDSHSILKRLTDANR